MIGACLVRCAPYSPPPPGRKLRQIKRIAHFRMTIRIRKFLGAIALILLAAIWSLLGMVLAQMPVIANSGWLQAVYYVVVGIGWVLPAMPIVSWMLRPDA
jgi:hypothetical protein